MAVTEFECIDGHTCGNPVRLVTKGAPELHGDTQAERRLDFLQRYDWMRTGLMYEPRGHAQMSGAFLYPPTRDDCDVAVLYIETSGCLPMCGHGTIGVVTMAIEHDIVTPKTPGVLNLDTPAGKVVAEYTQVGRKVKSVKLTNVPSFLFMQDVAVEIAALGKLKVDIAYGGSCTAGKREDFDYYHEVLAWGLRHGLKVADHTRLYLQFGTLAVRDYCREQGYLETFEQVGVELIMPGCGACANCGPGSSTRAEQVTISAINRNFPGRSGPGQVWLGSPYTVAASALLGRLTSFADLQRQVAAEVA